MTDTSVSVLPTQPVGFLQTWVDTLAQVLGEIRGTPLPCTVLAETPAVLPPPAEEDLWIVATLSGSLRGEMALRLPPSSTISLAQIFTGDPASAATELNSEHREAAVELFRQVGGLVATAVRAGRGEIQLHLDASSRAPSWAASSTEWIRVGTEEATAASIEIQVSAALVAALRTPKDETPPTPPKAAIAPLTSAESDVRLDLLMDVELAVTLRFGSRRLLLRDILELNSGAVVELDRQVHEPVDLLLDGRVVARGEVVVVVGKSTMAIP